MALPKTLRNISGPNPFSVIIRRELWDQLKGFNAEYMGPYALLDFALRARQAHWRLLYHALSVFICDVDVLKGSFEENDRFLFKSQWKEWLLQGDPYYNPNLSRKSTHYELKNS